MSLSTHLEMRVNAFHNIRVMDSRFDSDVVDVANSVLGLPLRGDNFVYLCPGFDRL